MKFGTKIVSRVQVDYLYDPEQFIRNKSLTG